jgi:hypothetical protein
MATVCYVRGVFCAGIFFLVVTCNTNGCAWGSTARRLLYSGSLPDGTCRPVGTPCKPAKAWTARSVVGKLVVNILLSHVYVMSPAGRDYSDLLLTSVLVWQSCCQRKRTISKHFRLRPAGVMCASGAGCCMARACANLKIGHFLMQHFLLWLLLPSKIIGRLWYLFLGYTKGAHRSI